MDYREERPGDALRPFIECVWFLRDRPKEKRAAERIVPDGCGELIVHFGPPFDQFEAGGFQAQPSAFLMAQLSSVLLLIPPRHINTMGVRFRPGGLARFIAGSVEELKDRRTPVGRLWGREAVAWMRSIRRGPVTTAARLASVNDFFERLLVLGDAARPDPRAVAAIDELLRSRGRTPVATIARNAGASERTLERAFLRDLGLPPKRFARIARLQGVMQIVRAGERADWTALAHECEYFDQSHLVNEFRDLTGETPREFVKKQGRFSQTLMDPERLRTLFENAR